MATPVSCQLRIVHRVAQIARYLCGASHRWTIEGDDDVLYLGPNGKAIIGELGEYKLSEDGKKLMIKEEGDKNWEEVEIESRTKDEMVVKDGKQTFKMKKIKFGE